MQFLLHVQGNPNNLDLDLQINPAIESQPSNVVKTTAKPLSPRMESQ